MCTTSKGICWGEYDASGNALQETVYLRDMPVAVLRQGGVYYVYADHLNAPRVITRASDNQIVWRWDNADPFGMMGPNENPSGLGTFTYNLRFPGQYYDRETGLFYNYFRDYDPATGRYIQSDPIGLKGGPNTYAYVNNQPTRYTDSRGLEVEIYGRHIHIDGPLEGLNNVPGIDHWWIKTDTAEAGMGPAGGDIPGQAAPDMPFTPTAVVDHSGESNKPGSFKVPYSGPPLNKQCVNNLLKPGRKTGPFVPFVNDCHGFVQDVIDQCSAPGKK